MVYGLLKRMTIHLLSLSSKYKRITLGAILTTAFLTVVQLNTQAITVRVERGLLVRQYQGEVTVLRGRGTATASEGDLLSAPGDGLRTGQRSLAVLEVDTDVGYIDVSALTELRIRALQVAADGGRITHLQVPHGQVRLRLRPFTHEGSEFELETPAGVTGVRGTEFGLSVQADGQTGVATLSGAVDTTAAGETVQLPAGFQNLMVPGEPPTQPVPLRDDPGLDYERDVFLENGTRFVALIGQVDPVNSVFVDGIPQRVDRQGQFTVTRVAVTRLRVEVVVVTPLGRQETYEIYLL